MTVPSTPDATRPANPNPAPTPVLISAVLVGSEALGIAVLAVLTVASGLRNGARTAQVIGQGLYFIVLALLVGVVAAGLLRGRRWSRTPAIVAQLVLIAIGVWLAGPSGRVLWGVCLIVLGLVAGGLLLTPPANAWIRRFPPLFGPTQDR